LESAYLEGVPIGITPKFPIPGLPLGLAEIACHMSGGFVVPDLVVLDEGRACCSDTDFMGQAEALDSRNHAKKNMSFHPVFLLRIFRVMRLHST
jgi:hypothetical protein